MNIKTVCLLTVMIITVTTQAQNKIQPLHVGDKMPDVVFKHILQYKNPTARFSDFKGKAVIIDFWRTTCIGCIESFPEMEQLQKKEGDKVQLMLATPEGQDYTVNFLKKKHIRLPALPMIVGDSDLFKMFPHTGVPHDVWINASGIIVAISFGENLTIEHINEMVNSDKINLSLKKDLDFKYDKPFIAIDDTGVMNQVISYSYFMRPIRGLLSIMSVDKSPDSKKFNVVFANSQSISELFTYAYDERNKYNFYSASNRVILDVKDTSKYLIPKDGNKLDNWMKNDCFTYNLRVRPDQADSLFKIMQGDLKRFFNVSATIEKRKIKCIVLVRTSNADKLKTRHEKSEYGFTKRDSVTKYIYNLPMERLSTVLDNIISAKALPTPFIDATGYTGNIDIEINAGDLKTSLSHPDFSNLRKDLQKYDLDLVEKDMLTNVLVITENGYKSSNNN